MGMANTAYLDFMKDPDPVARRVELAQFIGPNAESFLKIYDHMRSVANRPPGEKVKFSFFANGFNAGAFFLGPVWFFYRKLWGWAWGVVGLVVVLGLLPIGNRIGLPLGVGLAVAANQLYTAHAISAVIKMRAAAGGGPIPAEQLAQAGGVSKTAGWIAGGVYLVLVALGILALALTTPHSR